MITYSTVINGLKPNLAPPFGPHFGVPAPAYLSTPPSIYQRSFAETKAAAERRGRKSNIATAGGKKSKRKRHSTEDSERRGEAADETKRR